jgi:hypothetical protein
MPMVFPTSPVVGQVFSSGGRSWVWNGATWDSPAGQPFIAPGLVLLATQSFSGTNTLIFNNVFTSTYDTYKIILSASSSAGQDPAFRLRSGGAEVATSTYNDTYLQGYNGAASASTNTGVAQARFGRLDTNGGFVSIELTNPALPANTYGIGGSFDSAGFFRSISIRHTNSTAYDGFQIALSGTTGTISVYGIRKS